MYETVSLKLCYSTHIKTLCHPLGFIPSQVEECSFQRQQDILSLTSPGTETIFFFFSHLGLFFAIKLSERSISKSLARRGSSGDDKLSCASSIETLQGDNKTPVFGFRFDVYVHVPTALS